MTKLLNRILALALVLALTVPSLTAFASEGSPATVPLPTTPLGASAPPAFSPYAVNDRFIALNGDGIEIKYKVLTEDGTNNTVAVDWNVPNYSGNINIPATVTDGINTYTVTEIGMSAFFNCPNLTSVTIPTSVTTIGDKAFFRSGLTSVTIHAGVTTIYGGAFGECPQLTAIVVEAGNQDYSVVDDILFNKDQTLLHTYPLSKAGAAYTFPATVTAIESYAFCGNSTFTTLTVPNTITTIGYDAFRDMSELNTLILPEFLTKIPLSLAYGCGKITEIVIPASVTEIGQVAFAYCHLLDKVTFLGTVPPTIEGNSFGNSPIITQVIVPAGSEAAYSAVADKFPAGVVPMTV